MKDLIDELHAVTRTLGSATIPAGEARVITLERTYDADVDDVWSAVTEPDRIARWFVPVSGDLRAGGNYRLEDDTSGEIRACEPPTRLLVTWIGPGLEAGPVDYSLVEVRLEPMPDGRTRLTLEHTAMVPPEFWDQFGPGAVGVGWDLSVLALGRHLGGAEPSAGAALEADPATRPFTLGSSGAWGEAAVAAGVDAATAEAWVAATSAFYAPPPD